MNPPDMAVQGLAAMLCGGLVGEKFDGAKFLQVPLCQ